MGGGGVKTVKQSRRDKMKTLLRCPLCANWDVNKDRQRLGREAGRNGLHEHEGRGCSVLLHQTERHRRPVKYITGDSLLCFSLHSNLHWELRELLVATVAASNVLQSSACLSQGPMRLGDVGEDRSTTRKPF